MGEIWRREPGVKEEEKMRGKEEERPTVWKEERHHLWCPSTHEGRHNCWRPYTHEGRPESLSYENCFQKGQNKKIHMQ
jgi:hypothetical protein